MTDLAETTIKSGPVDDESDEDASEAQAQVIASLRAQVTDLFSQVTQLNSKLVASYDRVSDLEDQLHDTSSSLRNATISVSSLELERSHHLAALNTGLLVEKAHVTAELNRLMERATEEAAQRGQAESARHDIEKDLDDLSANLFDQANTMVAEARLNQAKSERKVQDAEQALKMAEDAVKEMQVQMQTLQAEKETAEREAHEAKATMGKGKWAERDAVRVGEVPKVRFMTTHAPYAEFIAFVGHLRTLRVAQQLTPPVISTLLSQPFLTRLVTEDSEPTVRLDLAPSLNWLSRRSVLAAIHSGMLTVEPLAFSSLVQELHQHPQTTSTSTLCCALCGTLVARVPSTPVSRTNHTNGGSWFKYPLALGTSQNYRAGVVPSAECEPPGQVYIFRLAAAAPPTPPPALTPVHNPSASTSSMVGMSSRTPLNPSSSTRVLQAQTQNLPYPLCTSNYCLTRLRSTCSLWAFVRVGIVERIWEENVDQPSKPIANGDTKGTLAPLALGSQPANAAIPSVSERPPVPPRRRRLWEMASAFGERAVSWSKESGDAAKDKDGEKENDSAKKPPVPPPSHPSVPHPHTESPTSHVHFQAPPLPKRKVVRPATDVIAPPSSTQNDIELPETKDPVIDADGPADLDKADANTPDPSSPLEEITFTSPPTESSPPPSTTLHPGPTELATPSIQDQPPPPSPHTVPLPVTPTSPHPISRVASPAPRPRSRLSSPASPPPSSRSASPAIGRSRTGSPTPRAASPSPGHAPSASHLRGKISMSSPLASSGSVSGPGAPPLPRRAARRPAPPLPPMSDGVKGGETSPDVAGVESTPEVPVHEAETETKDHGDGDGAGETTVTQAEPAPATEAAPEPTRDVAVDRDVEGSVAVPSDPDPVPVPAADSVCEGDGRTSMDTTSTKRSSSTEGEGFATDATWEERTWKEVVRLKEDMFWARIGGIRSV